MVSALDTGASGAGSSPAGDIVLCSWARHFQYSQVYVGTGEFNAWGNPAMD